MRNIRIHLCIVFLCIFSFFVYGQTKNNAPKIIYSNVSIDADNVNPNLNEIIIEFDQEMSSGKAFVATPNIPQITGKPKWLNTKTISVPVRLSPNSSYSLGLNNNEHNNFKSSNGIMLTPIVLTFKTKDTIMSVTTQDLNLKSYAEFQEYFPKKYSYGIVKGVDWDSLLSVHKNMLQNAKTELEFIEELKKILKHANDPHMWIYFNNQKTITSSVKQVHENYNTYYINKELKNYTTSPNNIVATGEMNDIVYLSINSWSYRRKDEIFSALKQLDSFKTKPYLIIDVRMNEGGSDAIAEELVKHFINDTITYEKVIRFNEKTEGFDNEYLRKVYPNKDNSIYSGQIYVLTGPKIISSNESFILMMKQIPNATTVGMKTYGSSGNPRPLMLSNGVTVFIPSWQAYTLDGMLIEGNGIEPDIEIVTSDEDFASEDFLFNEVINLIRKESNKQ